MSRPSPDDAAASDRAVQAAFDELGRTSFAEHSLESLVQKVTSLAAQVFPGQPVASVTIVRDGVPATIASSAPPALARVSMRTNEKVRDVADRFVRTGELPGT